jgi:hypothetical protein
MLRCRPFKTGDYALLTLLTLLAMPAAFAVELTGESVQGGLIFGKATAGSTVQLDGETVMVTPEGDFVIGFGRDETGERTLVIHEPSAEAKTLTLAVAPRDYNIERVDGLPPRTVTPDPEAAERIRQDAAMVSKARAKRD